MAKTSGNVVFDRNGVAHVDAAALLKKGKVQEQFAAGRKIVEAQKAAARKLAAKRLHAAHARMRRG